MGIVTKLTQFGLAAALALPLYGCSGGDAPTEDGATPSPTPVAAATTTPAPEATPARAEPNPNLSPLGGKPLTEEEAEYYRQQKRAEDFALAGNYAEALPILESAVEKNPDDPKNYFYLLLSYGAEEPFPTLDSKAAEAANKIVELVPTSNYAARARSYLHAAEFSLPDSFNYGSDTMHSKGDWEIDRNAMYTLSTPALFHPEIPPRPRTPELTQLWEGEAKAENAPKAIELPKDQTFHILSNRSFHFGLNSWFKPLPPNLTTFDPTHFLVEAFYIELTPEEDAPPKTPPRRGWIVNHAERYVERAPEDPWGVWIDNRAKVLRQADVKESR